MLQTKSAVRSTQALSAMVVAMLWRMVLQTESTGYRQTG
jgi:hypothetical protein